MPGKTIYLKEAAWNQWKTKSLEEINIFLEKGLKFMEDFAVFKAEAKDFLEYNPVLKKVLTE